VRPKGSEVLRLRADNRLARRLLGWRPKVPLDDGLGLTIGWILENMRLYKRGYTV
jgi:dTDP-glucose 4,6-dehydratase